MLTDIRIGSIRNRFQLPPAGMMGIEFDRNDVSRFESEMRSGMFESVFAGIETEPEEIICIRSMAVSLRLDFGVGTLRAALAWGEALAASLRELIAAAPSDMVLRYRDVAEARMDMLLDALSGDMRRAWVWSQLGFVPPTQDIAPLAAVDAAAAAIADAPEPVWPVIRTLLEAGEMPRALAAITPARWQALARRIPGATALLGNRLSLVAQEPTAADFSLVRQMLAHSPVARAWRTVPQAAEATLPVCALLIAYDDNPADVARASATVRTRYAALCGLLAKAREKPAVAAQFTVPRLTLAGESARAGVGDQTGITTHAAAGDEIALAEPRAVLAETTATPRETARCAAPPPLPQVGASKRLATEYGGLLFLLNLLVPAGLTELLADDGPLADCPLRVALDWLAREELGVPEHDAAIAAFCGVTPVALRRLRANAMSTPQQASALGDLALRLRELLAERLRRHDADMALNWLLARRGEIRFEPAWITLFLPMDTVDTSVRRAALDLDPGYLPWLGTVMRFSYE